MRFFGGWSLLLFVASLLFWANLWFRAPPRLMDVMETDSWYSRGGPARLAEVLPDWASRPPVVSLPYGSTIYFYYAPDPPPLDWVMPMSGGWSAPWELRLIADFCTDRKTPYVFITRGFEYQFVTEPSPIQEILVRDYAPFAESNLGLILKRKDHSARLKQAPSANGPDESGEPGHAAKPLVPPSAPAAARSSHHE